MSDNQASGKFERARSLASGTAHSNRREALGLLGLTLTLAVVALTGVRLCLDALLEGVTAADEIVARLAGFLVALGHRIVGLGRGRHGRGGQRNE